MKTQRLVSAPKLHKWAERNPPSGMVVKKYYEGYARAHYVYAKANAPWIGRGDPIAELLEDEIMLFHTNYFSDMQRLAEAYEKESGHEITLKYWQSPKDDPIK